MGTSKVPPGGPSHAPFRFRPAGADPRGTGLAVRRRARKLTPRRRLKVVSGPYLSRGSERIIRSTSEAVRRTTCAFPPPANMFNGRWSIPQTADDPLIAANVRNGWKADVGVVAGSGRFNPPMRRKARSSPAASQGVRLDVGLHT